jgi:hypothetical protein
MVPLLNFNGETLQSSLFAVFDADHLELMDWALFDRGKLQFFIRDDPEAIDRKCKKLGAAG